MHAVLAAPPFTYTSPWTQDNLTHPEANYELIPPLFAPPAPQASYLGLCSLVPALSPP